MSGHNIDQRGSVRKAFLISKLEADALLMALRFVDEDSLELLERTALHEFQQELINRWGDLNGVS